MFLHLPVLLVLEVLSHVCLPPPSCLQQQAASGAIRYHHSHLQRRLHRFSSVLIVSHTLNPQGCAHHLTNQLPQQVVEQLSIQAALLTMPLYSQTFTDEFRTMPVL